LGALLEHLATVRRQKTAALEKNHCRHFQSTSSAHTGSPGNISDL
jgi:hypothetical protein